MSSFLGPNTITDGLVLSLDAANTKSFRGEPTTNLVPSPYNYGMYAYADGPTDAINYNENNILVDVKRYRVAQAINVARAAIYPTSLTTGVVYAFSFKWKYSGNTTSQPIFTAASSKGSPEGGSNNNTMLTDTQNNISIGNGWNYYTYTFSFSACPTNACTLTFGLITNATASYVNEIFDIYEAQFEIKNYCTPYVLGSRGVTVATGGGWKDLAGNNDGELVNGVLYNSANMGSLVFNGSNNYINAPVTKTNTCTFCCWAKTTTIAGAMLFNAGPDVGGPDLYLSGGYIYWNTWDGGGNPFCAIPASATDGNWHQYIVVNDASTVTSLYYDGVVIGTAGYRNAGSNTNLTIGGNTNTYMWNGNISIFQVYNRALSQTEVQQNYNALKRRFEL